MPKVLIPVASTGPSKALGSPSVDLHCLTPVSLGDSWDTNSTPAPPYQCHTDASVHVGIVTGPNSNSNEIPYTYLTSLAGPHESALQSYCATNTCIWGNPAIMVTSENGGTVYLAASAAKAYIAQPYQDYGYFIFKSDLTMQTWTYYGGPFLPSNFINNPTYPSPTPWTTNAPNHITEFDWALRPDGNLVAVVTPSNVPSTGASETQYGCTVVDFSLTNAQPPPNGTGNPFGNVIATLTDSATGMSGPVQISEAYGANGCTYEPTSNTGIIIVRKLVPSTGPVLQQLYSLIETGVMP